MRIAFDPVFESPFSVNCYAFPEVKFDTAQIRQQKFAAVFISHYHDDHCSFASLDLLDRTTPIYMFCVFDEMFQLLRQLGFIHVFSLQLNQSIRIGEFEITAKRALDADVDAIFCIRAEELNVLNVVDAWIDPEMLNELKAESWDLILWPFQTMREVDALSPNRAGTAEVTIPPEWRAQLRQLNPRRIIPSSCQFRFESWSWLNRFYFPISYRQFVSEISEELPDAEIVRLNPGDSRALHKNSFDVAEKLSWVSATSDVDHDYEYDPGAMIPVVAEIAASLEKTSKEQALYVENFCVDELPNNLQTIENPDDFFQAPRNWKLKVYFSEAEIREYNFIVNGAESRMCFEENINPDWLTEIPAIKLWGAIAQGESLSSLYIRINDIALNPRSENDRESADILNDPLLNCLYAGRFASYQKAQLERLKI